MTYKLSHVCGICGAIFGHHAANGNFCPVYAEDSSSSTRIRHWGTTTFTAKHPPGTIVINDEVVNIDESP